MAYGVIFFISVIFIQSLLAEDILSKEEHSKLERYVQDLFDEKIASRDEEIKALKSRLNQAEKHIQVNITSFLLQTCSCSIN
jgi:hypothetical protein